MLASSPVSLTLYTPYGQRKYLSAAERQRFLQAALNYPRRDIGILCATIALTGCRISEALALMPISFDAAEGFVAIRCLKKRSRTPVIRQVPVPSWLLATIQGLGAPSPGSRIWPISRCRAWQLVKCVMTDAGIESGPHATAKGLRHAFGIHAIRCGVPMNLVQRWLGHASLATTAIYLQAMGDEERLIAARMWNGDCTAAGPVPADITAP